MKTLLPSELLGHVSSFDWLVSIRLVPVSFAIRGRIAEGSPGKPRCFWPAAWVGPARSRSSPYRAAGARTGTRLPWRAGAPVAASPLSSGHFAARTPRSSPPGTAHGCARLGVASSRRSRSGPAGADATIPSHERGRAAFRRLPGLTGLQLEARARLPGGVRVAEPPGNQARLPHRPRGHARHRRDAPVRDHPHP